MAGMVVVGMGQVAISASALLYKLWPKSIYMRKRKNSQLLCTKNIPSSSVSADQSDGPKTSPSIFRKLIWFHHIRSPKKKKNIREWGKELELGGYCKPGFPGVLIFEGKGENVADYLKRIKKLRWQHLQVRGEEEEQLSSEDQSVDSLRRFPMGIRELPESGMPELAEKCREANLEQLFLTALKISR